MNRIRSVSPRRSLTLAVIAAAAGIVWITSHTSAQTQVYGLWRDAQGGLWCGGTCAEGQQCCTITPLKPAPEG
jgi:hypothetical protein